ncbi:LLM class flavin-dependent oxidoreductase [Lysinibacter sp. HNR]|uniref:LLM class flavin-dependent oxidoreductase n=1 Tax=Lysinibacter sp. HNR TaxID=3031408 RepID=UPI002434999E|nr:LLM class flavin-dependent oxidoreductase [Lysinibacter sp. HNR]WGD36680.1 LLM class flavin-dependent oxidoreductase [Lysinibacter sp. HNR]
MKLSVLDLVPVRTGQSTTQALAAMVSLAKTADSLGFERFWLAEHHNMPSVASTNPPVLIAMAAAHTSRIRVGSGGVMLPNHSSLIIAEQFALLEAAHPGRIDLGIGRAPGSDPVITALLGQSGTTTSVDRFPQQIMDTVSIMSPQGTRVRLPSGPDYALHGTPAATNIPAVWLLGSSDYSARLAGEMGLPYVFAHHFAGAGLARALDLYRSTFRASIYSDKPASFLVVNAAVAETAEQARHSALPQLLQFARLRLGRKLEAVPRADDISEAQLADEERVLIDKLLTSWVVDEPVAAWQRIASLSAEHGLDEVMISPSAGSLQADPPDRSPARERTLELLVEQKLRHDRV